MDIATIVPLVTSSHGNVLLDSDEPASAADNSDVPAAAMFQASSFGSARGSSRSSAQVRHSRPSCSQPVARAHRRYRLQPLLLCPHSAGIPPSLSAQPSSEATMVWTDTHAVSCHACNHFHVKSLTNPRVTSILPIATASLCALFGRFQMRYYFLKFPPRFSVC